MPESISIIYCFPRSGGTLLNQCLLCAPANVVLSEVNPAGSVLEPEEQAAAWFKVLTPPQAANLKYAAYLEKISVIHRQTLRAERRLCIRDWTGLNFLPHTTTWVSKPSLQLEQRLYLQQAGYQLREIALLRRSRAVYDSIRQNIPEYHDLLLPVFAQAYRAYLGHIVGVDRFRLEELTEDRQKAVRAICGLLQLEFAADFETRFHLVTTVTGNTTLLRRPESASWTSIRSQAKSPGTNQLLADTPSRELFEELDNLAGYETSD